MFHFWDSLKFVVWDRAKDNKYTLLTHIFFIFPHNAMQTSSDFKNILHSPKFM